MSEPADILEARKQRLARLRQRLVAVTLRSRSLRLVKPTASGAFDLHRLGDANGAKGTSGASRGALDKLTAALGSEGGEPIALADVVPRGDARGLADDLAALAHAARGAWQETGVQDLAVGWPFVEGKTPDGTWLRGPILLYPVSLDVTKTGRARWAVTALGPPELNESLAHVLSRGTGARFDAQKLFGEEGDRAFPWGEVSRARVAVFLQESGLSLEPGAGDRAAITPLVPRPPEDREAVPDGRLALRSHVVLGRFPRSDSAILVDYDQLLAGDAGSEALGVAATLLSADEVDDDAPRADAATPSAALDEASATLESVRWQVFASDSSQDAALAHAAGGAGGAGGAGAGGAGAIVVQGPPGTGKSQMIANLVAEAIAAGRRVLVVCQKRAALDVVAERLASVGLREPVAIVHDVQLDRGDVCEAIAHTLQAIEGAAGGSPTDLEREALDDAREHALVAGRVAARIEAAQEAFTRIAGAPGGPPGLARLLERALDDDGRPLPDLGDTVAGVTEAEATQALPRIESLTRQTAPLAAPHALAARTDWALRAPGAMAEMFARVRRLGEQIQALEEAPRGAMAVGEAAALGDLWTKTAPLLDLFEARDEAAIKEFMLSWAWSGGDAAHDEWRRVTALLVDARATFEPAPHELLLMRQDAIEAHLAALARLDQLAGRWYRGVTPEYWRLKKVPQQILDACPSLEVRALDVAEARRLCTSALRWQTLIEAMPHDDVFWDLGLGGAMEDLDRATGRFHLEHARIAAVHDLMAALRRFGGPYASRRGLSEALSEHGADAPFFAAAVADRARARRFGAVGEALTALEDDFAADLRAEIAAACARDDFPTARARIAALLAAEPLAPEAARVDRLLATEPPWARRFLRAYRPGAGADPGADALVALDRAWVRAAVGDRTIASVEEPIVDEAQLRRLADDLAGSQRLAGRGVLAKFRQRLWAAARDPKRGVGLRKLAAEAARKRNRPTLRQLVERHWSTGLSLARPVWFCSPEAVSSLFPLSPDLFDIVVADEASQCPVEAAIPALARARRAIVAGDDQQMPPSHFFRAAVVDAPDEDDDEEEESVLASASILGLSRVALPGLVLRWHYRSRHEELVAFSNAAFYAGRLITAPRADAKAAPRVEGLHWYPVEGRWIDQTNPIEAARVVERIAALLAHEGLEGTRGAPSIGVVAFNRKQAELIERKLDERAAEDEVFRALWERDRGRSAVDQLFVRNLENVQGDERDVIVISTGYAPTTVGGRVTARFGPLGTAGGERRLNVAMTRARIGLEIVSSIDPGELDVSGTKNVGPKLLKAYLQFVHAYARAESGGGDGDADPEVARLLALAAELGGARGVTAATRAPDGQRRPGDRVRDALEAALRARGLRTKTNVGLGQRRLDLAVGLPGEEAWRVGVDCTQFLRDREALSRDVYTPRFWRRLGWRVVRVTPGMWQARAAEVVAEVAAMVGEG